jgi:hypothetical protein
VAVCLGEPRIQVQCPAKPWLLIPPSVQHSTAPGNWRAAPEAHTAPSVPRGSSHDRSPHPGRLSSGFYRRNYGVNNAGWIALPGVLSHSACCTRSRMSSG